MPFRWKFGPRGVTETTPGLGDLGEPFPGTEDPDVDGLYEMSFAFVEDPPGLAVLGIDYVADPAPPESLWTVDLCRGFQRIGQLQHNAFTFNGLERLLDVGDWVCEFPESEVSWSSFKDPDLPNYLDLTKGHIRTADAAALDVVGDIDVRWFGSLTDWDAGDQGVFNKWSALSNQRSWKLQFEPTGVRFYISTTGLNEFASTAIPVPAPNGSYFGVRFTRVQATGVTTCWFASDGVNWQAQAPTSTLAAGVALHNSTEGLTLAGNDANLAAQPTGRFVRGELRNGINGTVVASPDLSNLSAGRHLFYHPVVDTQGNVWNGFGANAVIATDSVWREYGPANVDSVRLVENGVIRFGGFVAEPSEGRGGAERTVTANGVRWTLSGPDMWHVLTGHVAFPNPAVADPTAWAVSHDNRTGIASTVLTAYLTNNLGVNALAERQVAGFAVIDELVGISATWSARLQPLSELVQRICNDAQLVCRIRPAFNGDIIATIGTPRDLSARYVLSDQGDLINVRSRFIPARSTWVLAGGQGEGTARTFRVATDLSDGSLRRERFSDQSSLQMSSELQASADATLRLDAATWSVSAEPNDAAADAIPFGREVLIGAKITVEVDGVRHVVPITEIAYHVAADRAVVRPTLGTASPDAFRGLIRDVANLASRFDRDVA